MASMGKIGDVCESQGEITVEWIIKNFSKLSNEKNIWYESQKFYFSGTSWEIRLYPNGQSEEASEGWLGLYISRTSTGFPVSINFTLSLKTADGKTVYTSSCSKTFDGRIYGWGESKVISRTTLTEKESGLTRSDTLTVICILKNSKSSDVAGSLFSRLQDISENLKEVYEKAKRTDCVLKVEGEKIPAHRIILESRSPVFAAMFNHDTKENQTGEISIDDIAKSVMEVILEYMYYGDTRILTTENVLSVYAAADKYNIKDLKEIALKFIEDNLSAEFVCDVIKFADCYHEEQIGLWARQYFKKNARAILETQNWKTFAKENPDIGVELLGSLVKALLLE